MTAESFDSAPPRSGGVGERIAVLCHGGGGGSTRAAMHLAGALDRRGRTVTLVTLGAPRWAPPAGLRHVVLRVDGRLPSRLDAHWDGAIVDRIARALATLCSREGIDLLHFHYGLPFAAAAALVRSILGRAAPAIVATLHGSDVTAAMRDPTLRDVLARALQSADSLSTVSTAYADMLAATLGGAVAPLVVPNFLPDDWAPSPRLRCRRRPPTIIHVSSFRAVKDLRSVVRAFLAVRRGIRCRLQLVGDGPDRRWLRWVLADRAADVDVLGFRHDVLGLLRNADLLLLASRDESFSLVALEAMAVGVPVVAPRIGGLPEVVADGVGGLLFHPGRAAHGAAKIMALLQAPIRRRRLGETARWRALGFTQADAVARYDMLYRLALARRVAATPQFR